jgi:hypothetical protein
LACIARASGRDIENPPQLPFTQPIKMLDFLFFLEPHSVVGRPTGAGVHSRRLLTPLLGLYGSLVFINLSA